MRSTVLEHPGATACAPSGADVWNAIVQAAIVTYRTTAFHAVTLQTVAEQAGLPLEVVTERFPQLDDLLVATVQVWNAERTAVAVPEAERHGAAVFLRALLQATAEDPSLTRMLVAMVSIAATPEHPMAAALHLQWTRFRVLVERALTRDVALGREPEVDPARGAEQLIALYEGMQLQSLMRPADDMVLAWDHAIARLRAGWAQHSSMALWEV